jgi:hypothetical protein
MKNPIQFHWCSTFINLCTCRVVQQSVHLNILTQLELNSVELELNPKFPGLTRVRPS